MLAERDDYNADTADKKKKKKSYPTEITQENLTCRRQLVEQGQGC